MSTHVSIIDLAEFDPGIRRTVAWLRRLRFDTTDSGDGRAKTEWIACGEALPFPHVAIRVAPEELIAEAIRLKVELEAVGIGVPPMGPEDGGVSIHASFDPGNGVAMILLSGVDDAALGPA